jgi:hypothetical protein
MKEQEQVHKHIVGRMETKSVKKIDSSGCYTVIKTSVDVPLP